MSIGVITKLAKYAARLTGMAEATGSRFMYHTASGVGAVQQVLADTLNKIVLRTDFDTHANAMAASMSDPNKFYLNNKEAFTITVGVGGHFSTINAAIDAAVRMRPTHNKGLSNCVIYLNTGFIMQEQVLIIDGSDLGWIRIVAAAGTVTVDPNFITQYLSQKDDLIPVFGADENSVLPVIGCAFDYVTNISAKDGIAVLHGSKVALMPGGCGVVRARRGLCVFYNSEAHCYPLGLTQGGDGAGALGAIGANFSYARLRGMHVAYGSRACMGRSDFSHCDGDFGVYVIWASYADCYHSNASWTLNGTGFHARDGSFLNCRESNFSHCQRGVHALHNGRINARSRINSSTVGQWIGEGGKYCTQYAVLASNNSEIEAAELDASFCTGSAAISASDASHVNFISGWAKNCSIRGVWAQNGSTISATNADCSSSVIGLYAMNGSTIAALGVTAVGCTSYGALAESGSNIVVNAGNLSGCGRGIEPRDGCSITARGALIANCVERAVSAIDGGRANVQEADLSGAGSRAITARNGAHVCAVAANLSGAVNWAAEIENGSTIVINGADIGVGPLSHPANILSGAGVIYQ